MARFAGWRLPVALAQDLSVGSEAPIRGRTKLGRFRHVVKGGDLLLSLMPTSVALTVFKLVSPVPTTLGIALRYMLIRRLASSCGENVAIFESVLIRDPQGLDIGSNVSIHPFSAIGAGGGVSIGSDVSIAPGCTIWSAEHRYWDTEVSIKDAGSEYRPVVIGSNVWMAARSLVLGGVSVGAGSVIAAGAVVKDDVPPGSLAIGVPATCRPIAVDLPAAP